MLFFCARSIFRRGQFPRVPGFFRRGQIVPPWKVSAVVGFYAVAILSGAEIMPGRGICRNYALFSTCRYYAEISTRRRKNSYIRNIPFSAKLALSNIPARPKNSFT